MIGDLIKESLKIDSTISSMRLINYIVAFTLLGIYLMQVLVTVVAAFTTKEGAFAPIDIPAVSASLIAGCLACKALQSFSKNDGVAGGSP